jgi:hypothetical protein
MTISAKSLIAKFCSQPTGSPPNEVQIAFSSPICGVSGARHA